MGESGTLCIRSPFYPFLMLFFSRLSGPKQYALTHWVAALQLSDEPFLLSDWTCVAHLRARGCTLIEPSQCRRCCVKVPQSPTTKVESWVIMFLAYGLWHFVTFACVQQNNKLLRAERHPTALSQQQKVLNFCVRYPLPFCDEPLWGHRPFIVGWEVQQNVSGIIPERKQKYEQSQSESSWYFDILY